MIAMSVAASWVLITVAVLAAWAAWGILTIVLRGIHWWYHGRGR